MKSIVVPANESSLDVINDFVNEELSNYDCAPKALFQIEVAIEEILVNIASYAGLSGDDGVEVRCEVSDDPLRVELQFLDGGVPFDPLAQENPDLSPEVLQDREGGLGILLVKEMMDGVSYVYESGKNTLTVLKHLN